MLLTVLTLLFLLSSNVSNVRRLGLANGTLVITIATPLALFVLRVVVIKVLMVLRGSERVVVTVVTRLLGILLRNLLE